MKKSIYFNKFNLNLFNVIFHLFKIKKFNYNEIVYKI